MMAAITKTRSLIDQYTEQTPGSAALFEEARGILPSGVAHDGRIMDPHPIYVERASGARKWDVDGREYVDFFGGHGSLILGHNHPSVREAIAAQLERGTHYGACHELEIRWAKLIRDLVPSSQMVRFTSSGTEATLLAVRLARAFTGRSKLLRIRGHFHGWNDHMTAGYASHFDGTPTIGVIDGIHADTILIDADDFAGLEKALASRDVAAAIIEPTGAHFGRIPISTDFLRAMRSLTETAGSLLIFDEVVTGFRVAPGGYQSIVGIEPDITTLAKILAGGLPGGALTGREDVFEVMDAKRFRTHASERVSHQGTYNANPLSAAAGIATLERLQDGEMCRKASDTAASIRDGFNALLARRGVSWAAYGDYSGFHIFTNPHGRALDPQAFDRSVLRTDMLGPAVNPALVSTVRQGLLAHGIDVNGQLSGWVSAIHGPAEIDSTLAAFDAVLESLTREGLA